MNDLTRAEWLTQRRAGLGGSDIAALLGISPWRSPLDLYLDKTGAGADDRADSEPMYWGRRLEDLVAHEWQERTGRKVQRVTAMMRHPDKPWMLANIDRAVVVDGSRARIDGAGCLRGAAGILECKTASAYAAADWRGPDGSDVLPVYYAAQCMWYLAVTGLHVCEVAVLIGGQQYAMRRVERDDDTIRGLIDRADEFWRGHVLAGVPPEPRDAADALKLWRRDTGELRPIDDNTSVLVALNELRTLRGQAKDMDARIDALEDELKLAIGPATGLSVGGRAAVTWRAAKDSTVVNWQAVTNDIGASVAPDMLSAAIQRHTTTRPGSRRFLLAKD